MQPTTLLTTIHPAATRPVDHAPAIEVTGLTLSYGSRHVLRGLDLRVERGEIVGILGHNGAGKTSLVEALQGLRHTDGGTMRVLGLDPVRDAALLRRRVGTQLQSAALPERMKVAEAVRLFARLAGDVVDARALMDEWGLTRLARRPFRSLSGGEQQRVFLALALVGRPELVFLDELTQGLDPLARRATWGLVERVRAQGATVVLVSHHMDEVEALCDRVGVLSGGRLGPVLPPSELVASHDTTVRVRFSCKAPDPSVADSLRAVPDVDEVRVRQHTDASVYEVTGHHSVAVVVAATIAAAGMRPTDFRVDPPRLEDVVVGLVGDAGHGSAS